MAVRHVHRLWPWDWLRRAKKLNKPSRSELIQSTECTRGDSKLTSKIKIFKFTDIDQSIN